MHSSGQTRLKSGSQVLQRTKISQVASRSLEEGKDIPEVDPELDLNNLDPLNAEDLIDPAPKKRAEPARRASQDPGESLLSRYLEEIHRIPMLTREEELEVANRAATGDIGARDTLVKSNLRFVVTVARRYQSSGLSFMDLINEGNLGLIKAAERFNPERGFHFISYAVWWIKQSILFAIQQKAHLIRLPLNRTAELRRLEEAERILENQDEDNGEERSEFLARMMGMKKEDMNHLLTMSRDHMSLDAPVASGEDYALSDNIEDTRIERPEHTLEDSDLKREIHESLEELTQRERKVLMMRFGLDGGPTQSLQKIGHSVGLSKERIRQIEKKAIRKIRTTPRNQRLLAYL